MTDHCLRPVLAILILALTCHASDWPQFRGPNRDNVSKDSGLLQSWPKDGPPLAWKTQGLGGGYSSISVAGDRIYTLGNKGEVSHVVALKRDSGRVLWSVQIGKAGGNLGCTPTVDGERVYALGQEGDLVCLEARDGKRVWRRNLLDEFGGSYGNWHYCESPLVDGDRVVVTPGGKEATMIALDKKTGETVWKCAIPTKSTAAGYSSIVLAEVGGVKHYVQLFDGGVVGVGTDGRLLWTYEKLGQNTANIPTPIVLDDHVLAVAGYGKGGALLKLKSDGKDVTAEEVYFTRALTNKHGGVVVVGDYVYGDTDDQGRPFCAEVKTGKVLWKRDRSEGKGNGSASVTYADGRLYFHYENGVVALVEASPKEYKEVGWFQIQQRQGPAWAHPVVVDSRLYLREGDTLYCFDVREKP
jgi:outer membrane protein assembly factor BamB